jgi:hypothetical protein
MEQKHKQVLVDNHVNLVTNLDLVNTHLLDYLYAEGLLQETDIQETDVSNCHCIFQFNSCKCNAHYY